MVIALMLLSFVVAFFAATYEPKEIRVKKKAAIRAKNLELIRTAIRLERRIARIEGLIRDREPLAKECEAMYHALKMKELELLHMEILPFLTREWMDYARKNSPEDFKAIARWREFVRWSCGVHNFEFLA